MTAESNLPAEAMQHIARITSGTGDVAIFQNDPALPLVTRVPHCHSAAPEDLSFRVRLQSEQKVGKVKQMKEHAASSMG